MRTAALCLVVALFGCAIAEPPTGYSYSRPSGGYAPAFSGGFGGASLLSGGGPYHQVPHGYQTSEGQHLDHQLLEHVRHIVLKDEIANSNNAGHSGGISSAYGVPSSSYGVPSYYSGRVVGVDLEGIQQAIQVAQYNQQTYVAGGYPSSSYGAPRAPSGSYGVPY